MLAVRSRRINGAAFLPAVLCEGKTMTLQDYMDTVPPDLKVSIGPNAGYFYIGFARKFDPEPINKRLVYNNAHNLRDREYEVNKYLKRHKSPPERYCRALERAKRKVAEFAPIETREVKHNH